MIDTGGYSDMLFLYYHESMQTNRDMCEGIGRCVVVHKGVRMLLLCFIILCISTISLGSMRER